MEQEIKLGKILRIARCANGMTVQEAHIASGVSAVYIGQLERDARTNPQIKILEKFGEAYDLKVRDFFELESYYNSLEGDERPKFRKTLAKALALMEENAQ